MSQSKFIDYKNVFDHLKTKIRCQLKRSSCLGLFFIIFTYVELYRYTNASIVAMVQTLPSLGFIYLSNPATAHLQFARQVHRAITIIFYNVKNTPPLRKSVQS